MTYDDFIKLMVSITKLIYFNGTIKLAQPLYIIEKTKLQEPHRIGYQMKRPIHRRLWKPYVWEPGSGLSMHLSTETNSFPLFVINSPSCVTIQNIIYVLNIGI